MRKLLRILVLFLLASALAGCNKKGYDPHYLKDDTVSAVVDSKTVFKYDDLTCQISFDRSGRKFAAFKDDMSSYYILTLGSLPSGSGQSIGNCSIKMTTDNDVIAYVGLTFRVEKADASSGKLWLWCAEKSIFIIAMML